MCKFSSKFGGVPFQPLGDLTWNDPAMKVVTHIYLIKKQFVLQKIIKFK